MMIDGRGCALIVVFALIAASAIYGVICFIQNVSGG